MKIRLRAAHAAIALAAVAGSAVALGTNVASAAQDNEDHKVTLCHATHSEKNPYVQITVDVKSANLQGHAGHAGPVYTAGMKANKVHWGDIIPAYNDKKGLSYPGLNLSPAGLAILNNGCVAPTPQTAPPTTAATPTTPEAAPNASQEAIVRPQVQVAAPDAPVSATPSFTG
jgi:hypothetical protein